MMDNEHIEIESLAPDDLDMDFNFDDFGYDYTSPSPELTELRDVINELKLKIDTLINQLITTPEK